MDAVPEELRKRISDPADLPKFDRFYRLFVRRMDKLGPDGGPSAMVVSTMKCWWKAFGAEWPETKLTSSPITADAGIMKRTDKVAAKPKSPAPAGRLKAALDARSADGSGSPKFAHHQRPKIVTRG